MMNSGWLLPLIELTPRIVISDEAPGTAVSIGVYADAAQAAKVAATVERAGFAPETSDRLRTLDVFWLDIDRQADLLAKRLRPS